MIKAPQRTSGKGETKQKLMKTMPAVVERPIKFLFLSFSLWEPGAAHSSVISQSKKKKGRKKKKNNRGNKNVYGSLSKKGAFLKFSAFVGDI